MLTNDQNIENLRKRKILRIIIIIGCFLTIFLSILSLVIKLPFIIPLAVFIVTTLLIRKRESIPLQKSKELLEIEKELKEHKKKGKRV